MRIAAISNDVPIGRRMNGVEILTGQLALSEVVTATLVPFSRRDCPSTTTSSPLVRPLVTTANPVV
jgi:hypothetical protein